MPRTKKPARPDVPVRSDRNGLTRCRVCGCTEMEPSSPPCAWMGTDLCSGCAKIIAALLDWEEESHRPNRASLLREWQYHAKRLKLKGRRR